MRNKVNYVDSFLHFSIFFLSYTKTFIYFAYLYFFFLFSIHSVLLLFQDKSVDVFCKTWLLCRTDSLAIKLLLQDTTHIKKKGNRGFSPFIGNESYFH